MSYSVAEEAHLVQNILSIIQPSRSLIQDPVDYAYKLWLPTDYDLYLAAGLKNMAPTSMLKGNESETEAQPKMIQLDEKLTKDIPASIVDDTTTESNVIHSVIASDEDGMDDKRSEQPLTVSRGASSNPIAQVLSEI